MPKFTTTHINDEVDLRITDDNKRFTPTTFTSMFLATSAKYAAQPALHYKRDGEWNSYTWNEYRDKSFRVAKSLMSLGFNRFDTVGICGFNSSEWFFSFVGAILAGGVPLGIYSTNSAAASQYVCNHAENRVIFVDSVEQLEKYASIADQLSALKALVLWNDPVPAHFQCHVPVHSFDAFLALGEDVADTDVHARIGDQRPGHCMSLIYTSGTTGHPKGVMISHDAFTFAQSALLEPFPAGTFTNDERLVSFLPLSHIAGQECDIGMHVVTGCHVYFAQPDALKGSLGATLKEVRPTFLLTVPRLFEKIMEKMQEIGRATTGLKKMIATWAKGVGSAKTHLGVYGSAGGRPWGYWLAHWLLFSRIREALGLDAVKYFFAGAAPLSSECFEYFASLDIPIYGIFGMSETSGVGFCNYPDKFRPNTVGVVVAGTQVKLDDETAEVAIRSRIVMMGYLKDQDQTDATIDADGWLRTGDSAAIDADGFVSITGRLKELLITAGGENVPPVLLEDTLRQELPMLANAMVVGDRRKFLTALLTFRVTIDADGRPTQELDPAAIRLLEAAGSSAKTVGNAKTDAKVMALLDAGLKRANARATSRAQHVQKYAVLETDFSIPGGELTPTLKLKRPVVLKQYADVVDALYN
ncbi:Aste57867_17825 [Aphanomyces stellatus]|uniref:Aste57867_17825 protein n=1 Tax=Aphanomyces stellatus TaxID=120398 RepID=A0A485L9F0_9STRA|nr:hypothetical protein As57867_017764 [Aphanomyces stellatus]VFT94568.1 Aste57867_17825 [Aphanomyces stellatus]